MALAITLNRSTRHCLGAAAKSSNRQQKSSDSSGPGGSSLLPKSFVYTFLDAAAVRGSNAGPNGQLLSTFMANNCQVSKGQQIGSTAA